MACQELQEALAGRLLQMARFRNLLVHRCRDADRNVCCATTGRT